MALFNYTGLSDQQTALIDDLNRSAAGLFSTKPPVNLEDPASLRQEAARLQQAGDQAGAIQMLNRAVQMENVARQRVTQQRQDTAHARSEAALEQEALTPVSANAAIAEQQAMQGRQREQRGAAALVARLREEGLNDEADGLESGILTPAQGMSAIQAKRRDEKGDIKTRKEAAQKAQIDRDEVTGAISVIAKTRPQEAAELMRTYGDTIQNGTPGEVAAVKAIVNSSRIPSADGTTDDAGLVWKSATGAQRDFVYDTAEDRIADMMDDKGVEEQGFWGGEETSGYNYLVAEAMNSVMEADNISDAEALEKVMTVLEAGEYKNLTEASQLLRRELAGDPDDALAQYF